MSRAFQDEGAARRALQVMEARRSGRETDLLHRVCHELLDTAELPIVLRAVLDHLTAHLGSDAAYLRVEDRTQPNTVIECVKGISGRELESLRAWLNDGPRKHPVRSLAAARQERPEDTLARFSITGQPDMDGVLVLDRRTDAGPTAVEEHRVILAIVNLIGDTVRFRRQHALATSQALPPTAPQATDRVASDAGDTTATSSDSEARSPQSIAVPANGRRSLRALLFAFEREILIEALHEAGGNQSRAARALHTTPRILTYRLKRHGLHGVLTKASR